MEFTLQELYDLEKIDIFNWHLTDSRNCTASYQRNMICECGDVEQASLGIFIEVYVEACYLNSDVESFTDVLMCKPGFYHHLALYLREVLSIDA